MSKLNFIGSIILILFITSCAREEFEVSTTSTPDGTYELKLFNEIQQITKTRINDEGFCDGDAVGVYVVNYQDGVPGTLALSGNQADNVKYTLEEVTNTWKPSSTVYYYDKVTHVDIYGYYPYGAPSSISEYPFEVQRDQSKEAANGNMATYEASDFLWAKTSDVTPVASAIPLQFNHKMAGVMVTFVEGTGFSEGEFASVSKAVLVTNTVRKAKINLAEGTVTPDGEVPSTGIIPITAGNDFRAVVVPQTVAAGNPLFTITVDGLPYTYRKDEQMEYVSGRLHKFSISVSKKSESGLEFTFLGEAITPWENDNVSHDATAREYVVIHCPEAGKLKETIIAEGKDYTKIKNLKVTGTITDEDYYFMRDEMPVLQSVNLKEVESINVYGNEMIRAIPPDAFCDKKSLVRFVFPEKLERIRFNAFSGTNLTGSLDIPEGVKIIESGSFENCPLNGTLTLPQSLEKIESHAFYNNNLRGELSLPNQLEEIGQSAFSNCEHLTGNLVLPERLRKIEFGAFAGCRGFTGSLKIPDLITDIPGQAFQLCVNMDGELFLPNSLLTIGDQAFNLCGFRYPLHLPNNLVVIGSKAFGDCHFSGELILPESLASLGTSCFEGNSRFSGILRIPEEISSISDAAFRGCQFDALVLPSHLEYIGRSAFDNCYQISSITCLALTPPGLNNSFKGVGKDNFTVEVPESAVSDYITFPGWNEFKRFSAHHEFSVNRNLFRTLNAENSKELIIRAPANAAWSVESKPEWITVTPNFGTGNTEIMLTAAFLSTGSGNREGEVVFLLDGKDYRVRTKVEQYDYQYGDGDVITYQTHSVGNGVDIVFMGDCFDAKDISEGKYTAAMEEAIGYFFDIEPYKTYQDYFNVYSVVGMSPDSGIGNVNTIREARFGTQYTLNEGLAPNTASCFEAACLAPINDDVAHSLVVLIENSEQYAGVTYMYSDGSAISLCPMSRDVYPYDFRGLIQHEAGGHGFGKLADEYIYHNYFVTNCGYCGDYMTNSGYYQKKNLGWYENIHHSGKLHDLPWYHLMFDPGYMGTVDVYEGAYLHTRGVFRSEPNSCMNNNIPYYNAISRESIVKRILDYAGEEYTFERFVARDVKVATMTKASMDNPVKWTDKFEHGHQQEPKFMGDKPKFNIPKK